MNDPRPCKDVHMQYSEGRERGEEEEESILRTGAGGGGRGGVKV